MMNPHPYGNWRLGPVFRFEWLVTTRRWQWYATRSVFATLLLAALILVVAETRIAQQAVTIQELARVGEFFFTAVVSTQLTLVLLAGPAATAGAICQDRASGMMTHVLLTDLTDAEVVLGKLAARLVPVLGLVGCGLPILAIMTLLGGVDPVALLGAFVISLGLAVLGCTLAFFFSLYSKKTHEALLGTYAVWGLWLLARPILSLMHSAYGVIVPLPSELINPYALAFAPYSAPTQSSWSHYAWFVVGTFGTSAVLAVVIVGRLRLVCTHQGGPPRRRVFGRIGWLKRGIDPTRYLPGPSLDFNPVCWREWHRTRSTPVTRIVSGIYIVCATVASVAAIVAPRATFAMAWVNGLQVAVGMLIVSVLAATSLADERVRGSLDVLMATTLSTRQIVLGKWLGAMRLVPALAILPVLVLVCNDFTHPEYLPTILFTFLFVLVCGAMICGFGLLMGTWLARPGRAVTATVVAYVMLTVGSVPVIGMLARGLDVEGKMMISPFFFPGMLAADLCSPTRQTPHLIWAMLWLVVYLIAATVFLTLTLVTFNKRLGRVENGWSRPL